MNTDDDRVKSKPYQTFKHALAQQIKKSSSRQGAKPQGKAFNFFFAFFAALRDAYPIKSGWHQQHTDDDRVKSKPHQTSKHALAQ